VFESLVSLVGATTLLLGSPGPATLALAATGASYGVKRGTPFLIGILTGLAAAIIGAAAGLAALFTAFPASKLSLQIAGSAYIIYLAIKVASAPVFTENDQAMGSAPLFRDGFIINLLNPKAYAAFLAIFSQFLLPFPGTLAAYASTGFVCILVGTVVDVIWLCFGSMLSPLFRKPAHARVLRITFALLMVYTALFAFIH
jgi:threonine/homoserine/homoserine lactone efflux protein